MSNKNKMLKCEFYNSDNKLSCYSCNYAKECLIMQIKEIRLKCKEQIEKEKNLKYKTNGYVLANDILSILN